MRLSTPLRARLLCLLMVFALVFLTACGSSPTEPTDSSSVDQTVTDSPAASQPTQEEITGNSAEEQERFSAYTHDLFVESILANTVNLHYSLADPESFGITEYPITLGTYDDYTEEEIRADLEEMAAELDTYHYELLTDEQKMTYDILQDYITTESGALSLYLYNEPLGVVTGDATQMPVVLAEYSFYREKDIQDYLELLAQVGPYFESLIAFEQKKAEAGLFMPEYVLDANLQNCEDFLSNKEENFLITSFASRMENIDWLDDQAKADYTEQNRAAVNDSVFPAYEYLAQELESMRSYCSEDGGLSVLPEGTDYFAYLMASRIGPDRTPEEMMSLIQKRQQIQLRELITLYNEDNSIETAFYSFSFSLTDPAEILDYLKEKANDYFPEIPDTTYTIKYVEKELEDVLSPAFYMIPPLDRYQDNTIYINNGSVDETTLFATLAHEGYPGHLYQNVYFNSHNSEPLRQVISFTGYSEGWATYVEYESYGYDTSVKDTLARFTSLNNSIMLSVYAALDIGINYEGWGREDAASYIAQFFGELDSSIVDEIFNAIGGDPCNYLCYYGGYLEILEMRDIAEQTLGDKFDLKEFHRFVLDLGECPFSLANNRLADWLEAQN